MKSGFARVWLQIFLALVPISTIWALANPMFASPDEPAHMVRAQGAIRGDFSEPYLTDGIPGDEVACMMFDSNITADCMDLSWRKSSTPQGSSTNNYPPLFHLVAGVPSLFVHGLLGAYIMRVWMVLVCSLLISLAGAILFSRLPKRWTMIGFALSLTPMVIFTIATINPSGLTVALSSLIWATGISLIRPRGSAPPNVVRSAFIISLILFPFLRRDALAWQVLILGILACLVSRRRALELLRDRIIVISLLITALSMSVVWFTWSSDATESFVSNSAASALGGWGAGIGSLYSYTLQLIGLFGWLDSPMTNEMWAIYSGMLFLGLFLGLSSSPSRERQVLALSAVMLYLAPSVIGAVRYPYVQGRYLFPIFIGVFFLVGQVNALNEDGPTSERFLRIFAPLFLILHFFAFAQNLRRYAVGRTGSWNFWRESMWHPPMMSNSVTMLLAIVSLGFGAMCITRVLRASARASTYF